VAAVLVGLLLVGCSVAVLAFGTWRVQCPGLYYDEVLFVEGWQPRPHFAWVVDGVPIMSLSYLGALKSWLYWPLQDRLSAGLVRLPTVLLAIVSLWLTAAVAARLAGTAAAIAVACLLAVDPALLFVHRLDWGPVAIAMLLRMASLALLLRWRSSGGGWCVVVAAFLIGVGLYDKVIFAWYVMALALAVLTTWRQWPRPRFGLLAGAAVATLIGAAPLVAYNLQFPLTTFHDNAILTTRPLLRQIVERGTLIVHTLSGADVYFFVNGQRLTKPLPCPGLTPAVARIVCGRFALDGGWLPWATVAALVAVGASRALRTAFATRFVAVLLAGIIAVILPLAQATGAHHVAMMLPFPQLLLAVVAAEAWRQRLRWRPAAVLAVVVVVGTSLAVSARTVASFAGLCGRGAWSPATYRLAAFAAANAQHRLLLGDWGFAAQIHTLAPQATPEDWSWALIEDRASAADLRPQPGRRTFLLVHTVGTTVAHVARQRAFAYVRAAGLHAKRHDVATDLDGRPTAFVLELVPRRRRR
jgi:hypothetical protein